MNPKKELPRSLRVAVRSAHYRTTDESGPACSLRKSASGQAPGQLVFAQCASLHQYINECE